MKKRIPDSDKPRGTLKRVEDFLPPPERLVVPEDTLKITLLLDRASVEFFKDSARRSRTKYQRMMREVLKRYAHLHAERPAA